MGAQPDTVPDEATPGNPKGARYTVPEPTGNHMLVRYYAGLVMDGGKGIEEATFMCGAAYEKQWYDLLTVPHPLAVPQPVMVPSDVATTGLPEVAVWVIVSILKVV